MFLLSKYFIPAAICEAMSKILVYEIDPLLDEPPASDVPLEVDAVVEDDVVEPTLEEEAMPEVAECDGMVTRESCRR